MHLTNFNCLLIMMDSAYKKFHQSKIVKYTFSMCHAHTDQTLIFFFLQTKDFINNTKRKPSQDKSPNCQLQSDCETNKRTKQIVVLFSDRLTHKIFIFFDLKSITMISRAIQPTLSIICSPMFRNICQINWFKSTKRPQNINNYLLWKMSSCDIYHRSEIDASLTDLPKYRINPFQIDNQTTHQDT